MGGRLGRQVQTGQEGAERRVGGEKPGFQACGAVSWPRPSSAQLLCRGQGKLPASDQHSSWQENEKEERPGLSRKHDWAGGRHRAAALPLPLGGDSQQCQATLVLPAPGSFSLGWGWDSDRDCCCCQESIPLIYRDSSSFRGENVVAGPPGLIRVGSSSERGARSPCASKNSQGDPPERGAVSSLSSSGLGWELEASCLQGWAAPDRS